MEHGGIIFLFRTNMCVYTDLIFVQVDSFLALLGICLFHKFHSAG